MSAPRIEIDDAAVRDMLERVARAGERPDPILTAFGRQLKTNIQLGFQRGVDPYGTPWAPLKVRNGQPLRDKGHLMNSIDYQVSGNAVDVGTNKAQALVQQRGATIKAKPGKSLRFMTEAGPVFVKQVTIPPRPFMPEHGLPGEWREDLLAVGGDFLGRLANG